MKSLYDLLGARENDDRDALKKAFRRVIKANHPDLHPGDPNAAERFRQIIAANACLRDPKQRASYDRLLQGLSDTDAQASATPVEEDAHHRSDCRRQCADWRIRAVGDHTHDRQCRNRQGAAAAGATVEKQTATVVAAAKENENPSAAIGAANADAVKGDKADEPVEPLGAVRMQRANPADQGEQRHKHDSAEVPNGTTEPSPTASGRNSGDTLDIAERELALS